MLTKIKFSMMFLALTLMISASAYAQSTTATISGQVMVTIWPE